MQTLTTKQNKHVKIEGNIIENLPIIYSQETNLRTDQLKHIIKLKEGTLTVRYHKDLGPLTGSDLDTLIAVSLICAQYGYTQKFPATAQKVRKMLGLYKSGENIKRVGESLLKLAGTFMQFHGSFYNYHNRKYVGTAAFHLLSYYFFSEKEKREVTMKELFQNSFVEWNSLIYTNLVEGYFKFINTKEYFSLTPGITRGAYLYLEKRLGKKESYSENIKNLLKNITHQEEVSKHEMYHFKIRTLEALKQIYYIKIANKILTISKVHKPHQLKFPIKTPRPELTEHEEEVLNMAEAICEPKTPEYFRNTIKKFIHVLGADRVSGAISDTQARQGKQPPDRYLITLLKNSVNQN